MKAAHLEITSDSQDFILFHTSCVCDSPQHVLTVIVEKSSGPRSDVEMSLCFEVGSIEQENEKWRTKFTSRLKRAWKILSAGNLWPEDCFIFRSASHARKVIDTMQEAVDQIKNQENTVCRAPDGEYARNRQVP